MNTLAEEIAKVTELAQEAIDWLQMESASSNADAPMARTLLGQLREQAIYPSAIPVVPPAIPPQPDSPPPGETMIEEIVRLTTEASAAIAWLQGQAALSGIDATVAQASLALLAAEAVCPQPTASPPPPPPAPPPPTS